VTSIIQFFDTNPLALVLFCFIFLDMVSGLFASGKAGKLSSTISFAGVMKKCQILVMCATFALLEWVIYKILGQRWPLAGSITIYFCVTEIISITENAERSGLYVPKWVKPLLASIRERAENSVTITPAGGGGLTVAGGVTVAPLAEVVEVVQVHKTPIVPVEDLATPTELRARRTGTGDLNLNNRSGDFTNATEPTVTESTGGEKINA
jgi:toxin secretion/phage lysis holin